MLGEDLTGPVPPPRYSEEASPAASLNRDDLQRCSIARGLERVGEWWSILYCARRQGYCEDLREPAQDLPQQKLVAAPIMGDEAKIHRNECDAAFGTARVTARPT